MFSLAVRLDSFSCDVGGKLTLSFWGPSFWPVSETILFQHAALESPRARLVDMMASWLASLTTTG